jgi:hypothetical protein
MWFELHSLPISVLTRLETAQRNLQPLLVRNRQGPDWKERRTDESEAISELVCSL